MTESDNEKVIELVKSFPNDQDLGYNFRLLFSDTKLSKSFSNDFELGGEIRKRLNDINNLDGLLLNLKNIEERLDKISK